MVNILPAKQHHVKIVADGSILLKAPLCQSAASQSL